MHQRHGQGLGGELDRRPSDEVEADPVMGGYQLPIATDIFRGRYRETLAEARPIQAATPLRYEYALPNASHTFRPGHRIMVQIQSSWFCSTIVTRRPSSPTSSSPARRLCEGDRSGPNASYAAQRIVR